MIDIKTASLIIFSLVGLQIAKYFEVRGEILKSKKVEDFVVGLVRKELKHGMDSL